MAAKTANNKGSDSNARVRKLDGKLVIPTLFGKYMAGMVDGALVLDSSGKPLPLRQIGQLVPA